MTPEKSPAWQPDPIGIEIPRPTGIPLKKEEGGGTRSVDRGYVINGEDPRFYEGITSKIEGDGE